MPTFVLLTIVLVLNSFEPTCYVAWAIATLWVGWQMLHRGEQIAVPRSLVRVCAIPVLLLLLASPGAAFHPFRDVARDLWLFINPIVYIVFGYLLFEKIRSWSQLLQPFILVGLVASLYAVWNAYTHRFLLLSSSTVEEYRTAGGSAFAQAMVPIILILMSRRFHLPSGYLDRRRFMRVLLYVVGMISIGLSLSRTFFFILLAGLLLTVRLRKLRNDLIQGKLTTVALTAVVVGAVGFAASTGSSFSSSVKPSGSFMDKLANIPEEIGVHHFDTYDEINRDWRGFEAYRALVTYERFSPREAVMGAGLGTLVDLGFAMPLSPVESFQFVPTTHNGFAFLLVKNGPLGLLLFFVFVYLIARRGWRNIRSHNPNRAFVGYLLLWIAITLVMTQAVVNGLYNRNGLSPILLLLGAAYAKLRELDSEAEQRNTEPAGLRLPLYARSA